MRYNYSPFDLAVIVLVSFHLLFSLAAAGFVLHFHFRSSSSSSSSSPSLRRRLHLLVRLNSVWPVRLLLVLFASLLPLSELLRLSLGHTALCKLYALSSQSFAEPSYFATLLFLLRASTQPKQSPSLSFASAFSYAALAASPFLILYSLFLVLSPWALKKQSSLPAGFLTLLTEPSSSGRCAHNLFGTMMLAVFGTVYMPMFISTCWNAVNVVINKRLRARLYALAATVAAALSVQVTLLALSSLWTSGCGVSQGLGLLSFGTVLVCVVVGEGILVVQPVLDALAIVAQEGFEWDSNGEVDGQVV